MYDKGTFIVGAVIVAVANFFIIVAWPGPTTFICNGLVAAFSLGLALVVAAKW